MAAMPLDTLSTMKWDSISDRSMVDRVYIPLLRAAVEKAQRGPKPPVATVTQESAVRNQSKRSRSAEARKELKRAERKRRKVEENEKSTSSGQVDLAAVLETLGVAMKPKPQLLAINTVERMKALELDESFDLDQCPPQMAVRKLLSKATEQQKALDMKRLPFVTMNLREFLPGWCADASPVLAAHGTAESANSHKGVLDPVTWRLAWSRFALAAAMVGTMPMDAAMIHRTEVNKLTLEGRTMGGRRVNLGIVYDEVCRRKWSEYSQALKDEFNISDVVEDVAERAKMKE